LLVTIFGDHRGTENAEALLFSFAGISRQTKRTVPLRLGGEKMSLRSGDFWGGV